MNTSSLLVFQLYGHHNTVMVTLLGNIMMTKSSITRVAVMETISMNMSIMMGVGMLIISIDITDAKENIMSLNILSFM